MDGETITIPENDGGGGGILPGHEATRSEDSSPRPDLDVIKAAVTGGWEIPEEWKKRIPIRLLQIIANGRDRDARGAAEILRKMAKDNVDAAKVYAQIMGDLPVEGTGDVNINMLIAQAGQAMSKQPDQAMAAITQRLDSLFEPPDDSND